MDIGFIGAGKMAAAIACGAIQAGFCPADRIFASARTPENRKRFAVESGGARTTDDNLAVAESSDTVFLCVKPADARAVASQIAPVLARTDRRRLLVSVAAGVPLAELQAAAGTEVAIVRVMPNTPCLVGCGASAYAKGEKATDEDAALVGRIFTALGNAHAVSESLIDAVNGLSGSGPAYVYLIIEALADGGVLMGLPRALAASLATQTVRGAAEMVRQTGRHPAELREAVASPGGTTIAALETLELSGVRAAIMGAVRAATERAREMGQPAAGK